MEMEKGKPKCIRKKGNGKETELKKCLYNDVCLYYSRPTRPSSVVYVLFMAFVKFLSARRYA